MDGDNLDLSSYRVGGCDLDLNRTLYGMGGHDLDLNSYHVVDGPDLDLN